MVTCTRCGLDNRIDAVFCAACGADLIHENAPNASREGASGEDHAPSAGLRCGRCEVDNNRSAAVCRGCGAVLGDAPTPTFDHLGISDAPIGRRSILQPSRLGLAVGAAVVSAAVLFALLSRGGPDQDEQATSIASSTMSDTSSTKSVGSQRIPSTSAATSGSAGVTTATSGAQGAISSGTTETSVAPPPITVRIPDMVNKPQAALEGSLPDGVSIVTTPSSLPFADTKDGLVVEQLPVANSTHVVPVQMTVTIGAAAPTSPPIDPAAVCNSQHGSATWETPVVGSSTKCVRVQSRPVDLLAVCKSQYRGVTTVSTVPDQATGAVCMAGASRLGGLDIRGFCDQQVRPTMFGSSVIVDTTASSGPTASDWRCVFKETVGDARFAAWCSTSFPSLAVTATMGPGTSSWVCALLR